MTHKHEWRQPRYPDDGYNCECGAVIWNSDVLCRLNATECLSAEDAKIAWVKMSDMAVEEMDARKGDILAKSATSLCDYARALDGSDE